MNDTWRREIRDAYKSAIGRKRHELVTPALILDLDKARKNIESIMEKMVAFKARLRPHIKCQKCTELALMQQEAGAIGVCAATVWEAIVMSRAGIKDVLIANQVVGAEKIRALAAAARNGSLTVAVDDPGNVDDLSRAVQAAKSTLDVLIEVDVGMGRGGVRSADEAVALAKHIDHTPGLRLRGVQGYEGHCMHETDPAVRTAKVKAAMDHLGQVVKQLARAGFNCQVVSSGGTGTYDITGALPLVTEIQAGSYVFMDIFHGKLVNGFANALTVLGTVAVKHGRTLIFDAGRKSIGTEFFLPALLQYPDRLAGRCAEEHTIFEMDGNCPLKLGDTAELIPGYAPSTVNLYDVYHVVEKDVVVDIWPIIPRGPGHVGLLS